MSEPASDPSTLSEPASEPSTGREQVQITLLTQASCRFCDQAKHVLNRLAAEYPLQIIEIDLAGDEGRRLAAAAGVMFPPGVLVDGEPFSFGRLSERRLRRRLDQHRT